jgi:hypothetical protein
MAERELCSRFEVNLKLDVLTGNVNDGRAN